MKQTCWIVLMVIGALCLGPVRPAAADAAPPWYAQGASVETSESMTQVQMVSEEVLLVVQERPGRVPEYLAAESMTGHVEATFVMRNQGTVEESFDVWFPLGIPMDQWWSSDLSDLVDNQGLASNFAAWVNGESVAVSQQEIKDQSDSLTWWAAWTMVFPPGQDVVLRVTYDVSPVGWEPYGTFYYVLQTGAGWWGPIQEGTVTFRLPYEVDSSNTVLDSAYGQCFPDTFSIEGEQAFTSRRADLWYVRPIRMI